MLKSVEGVLRDGKIELLEPVHEHEGSRVVVTFLPVTPTKNLADHGIGPEQAANLRARLGSFSTDWEDPEMDVYDAF